MPPSGPTAVAGLGGLLARGERRGAVTGLLSEAVQGGPQPGGGGAAAVRGGGGSEARGGRGAGEGGQGGAEEEQQLEDGGQEAAWWSGEAVGGRRWAQDKSTGKVCGRGESRVMQTELAWIFN